MLFQGSFWDCTGGGGSVGSDTHCDDAPADWRRALVSTRLDEEEMVRAEEDVEAMMSLNLNKALIFLLLFFLFLFCGLLWEILRPPGWELNLDEIEFLIYFWGFPFFSYFIPYFCYFLAPFFFFFLEEYDNLWNIVMLVLQSLGMHNHSFYFHLDSVMTWPLDRNFMVFDWMEGSSLDPFLY